MSNDDNIKEMLRSKEIRKKILNYISYESDHEFLNQKVPQSLFKYLKFNEKTLEC